MQILPSESHKYMNLDFWFDTGNQSDLTANDTDFLSAMQDAMSSVSDGESLSVNTALHEDKPVNSVRVEDSTLDQPQAAPVLVDSPYSRQTDDGLTYTMDEVNFTKQELQDLRKQLVQEGVPEEALAQFDILVGQPDGATLAQVLGSLTVNKRISLTDKDANTLTALLNQIDPSGDLSLRSLQLMGDGRGAEALRLIKQAFATLDPQSTISISREDARTLGKALGLSKQNMQALMEHFGKQQTLEVNSAQFARLMGSASMQFAAENVGRQKLDAALDKTLRPIMNKARARMEEARKATALQNRTVEQSKVLINKTVEEKSRDTLDKTLQNGQGSTHGQELQIDKQSQIVGKAAKSTKEAKEAKDDRETKSATDVREAKDVKEGRGKEHAPAANRNEGMARVKSDYEAPAASKQDLPADGFVEKQALLDEAITVSRMDTLDEKQARASANTDSARNSMSTAQAADAHADRYAQDQNAGQNFGQSAQDRQNGKSQNNSGWSELLGKTKVQTTAPLSNSTSVVYSMLQGSQSAVNAGSVQGKSTFSQQISRQVAHQVEQSVLSAMKSGGTRMDLQLNPVELGALNITLTARNGEVSATIRSERSETAEMLSRQMESIRLNLEQQGIKVDKIEVQLQSQNDSNGNNHWENLDQHNSWQEEDSRREELARLRNLATIRNSSKNEDKGILEQPMQSIEQTARNATRSLHVVA